jgi:hypothetical protein
MFDPNAARLLLFPIFNGLNGLTLVLKLTIMIATGGSPNRCIEQHSTKAHTYHVCRALCTAAQGYAQA